MAKVLIVDDEPIMLDLIEETLAGEGCQVKLARDGDTALRWLREERFEVVLVDLKMPKVTGWELLEELEGDPDGPRAVVVSARAGPDEVAKAFDLGAVDVVVKPFRPDDLSRLVAEVAALEGTEVAGHRKGARARHHV